MDATKARRAAGTIATLAVITLAACTGSTPSGPSANAGAPTRPSGPGSSSTTSTRPPSSAHATDDPTVVVTDKGGVKGETKEGVARFVGIPYAAPPVGNLRWRLPQAHAAWSDTRAVTKRPDTCPQQLPVVNAESGAEDCLFLNVYRPADAKADEKLPVMVWFHGGAFVLGSPYLGTDGDIIAKKQRVVVVTVAYRLGALGFLAHPALMSADDHNSTGAYGIADQIQALGWVQDNVAAFGGDKANVTAFGESAGGWSVCALMASPQSQGLFHKAIIQSGPCGTRWITRDENNDQGRKFATAAGCDGKPDVAACLRAVPADKTVTMLPTDDSFGIDGGTRWSPSVDDWIITSQTVRAVNEGRAQAVPVLMGWNLNEGKVFTGMAYASHNKAFTADDLVTKADFVTAGDAATKAKVLDRYAPSKFDSPMDAFAQIIGDGFLACPGRQTALALSAKQPVYAYSYAFPKGTFAVPMNGYDLGAAHSVEIQFVFGIPQRTLGTAGGPFDATEQKLSDEMMTAWATFARTGTPGSVAGVEWPRYSADGQRYLRFDEKITAGSNLDKDTCDFWATLDLPVTRP